MNTRDHSAELGDYLRTRRQALRPEHVGMATSPRRRAHGLLREEVAILANISTSWYELLERGEPVRPSASRLDAIADALRLDETNRRYLHALGTDNADLVRPDPALDDEVVEVVDRIVATRDDADLPVFVTDCAGNLLSWNSSTTEWYDDFAAYEGEERNIGHWLFLSPRSRERLVGWEHAAREAAARMRYDSAFHRTTAPIHDTTRALRAESPEFAAWWDTHDVRGHVGARRTFRHPRHGVRSLELVVVNPDRNPSLSIVFHLPATEPQPDGEPAR